MQEWEIDSSEERRSNVLRFGLLAIPPVAWAVAFAPLFLVSNGFRMDWVDMALIPSLVEAFVVGMICYAVWLAYDRRSQASEIAIRVVAFALHTVIK